MAVEIIFVDHWTEIVGIVKIYAGMIGAITDIYAGMIGAITDIYAGMIGAIYHGYLRCCNDNLNRVL